MATSPNFGWLEPDNTDLVKNGALAIRTLGNAIDASMADLKGGTTGQVLAKQTNTDMDFVWTTPSGGSNQFFAGKNKIINGDFSVNQRNFTSTTSGNYGFDRFYTGTSGGTVTSSAQTFTLGTAPVTGYEGKNYLRVVTSGQSAAGDFAAPAQRIESVRTFANQTVTFSFWAKAATGTPQITLELFQIFGTGGSPSSAVIITGQNKTLSTSWTRYSATFSVPSISGKTIGTNNDDYLAANVWLSAGSTYSSRSSIGIQNNTFELWGWQLEAGSTATDFQTATGTLQGELAACQRYYISNSQVITWQGNVTNAQLYIQTITFPVQMRIAPTITQTSYAASSFNAATLSAGTITVGGYLMNETASATASGAYYQATYTANAEL